MQQMPFRENRHPAESGLGLSVCRSAPLSPPLNIQVSGGGSNPLTSQVGKIAMLFFKQSGTAF
ncbi:hypothetical protein BLL40_12895 [Domibacillus mangrovi]|uniref:Uncharacterized protein n=1 Tax=Domibacillus mangrovi TaxID=1714354 RepID=A0A1Q5P197_9BACI|nr:hypothetical protein BLL40_12895 [Domibacillus mangrovi]